MYADKIGFKVLRFLFQFTVLYKNLYLLFPFQETAAIYKVYLRNKYIFYCTQKRKIVLCIFSYKCKTTEMYHKKDHILKQ